MSDKPQDDLDVTLSYLKRQRTDIDSRIKALETSRKTTTDILSDIEKLRQRVEKSQIGSDDPTVKTRR
jgi:hypothetical protein